MCIEVLTDAINILLAFLHTAAQDKGIVLHSSISCETILQFIQLTYLRSMLFYFTYHLAYYQLVDDAYQLQTDNKKLLLSGLF